MACRTTSKTEGRDRTVQTAFVRAGWTNMYSTSVQVQFSPRLRAQIGPWNKHWIRADKIRSIALCSGNKQDLLSYVLLHNLIAAARNVSNKRSQNVLAFIQLEYMNPQQIFFCSHGNHKHRLVNQLWHRTPSRRIFRQYIMYQTSWESISKPYEGSGIMGRCRTII